MFTVEMEKQCGCFKRSDYEAMKTFENKDEALMHAQTMASDMNETFCQKHNFTVVENGENFTIVLASN